MTNNRSTRGDDHATALTPAERQDLIPTHITLRSELNELEQKNIAAATRWAFERRHVVTRESFLRGLHRRMFNQVWRWAGTYRNTKRNLGVSPHLIEIELHNALNDARYWIEHRSYPEDEIAVRFHHRLVCVHPFPNGNGRWSRLTADALIAQLGRKRFTWGGAELRTASAARDLYITALKAADNHDLRPLVTFARS